MNEDKIKRLQAKGFAVGNVDDFLGPEGEQVGRAFGYAEDEEATAYPMTREDHRRWHGSRQATPSLAYCLMGVFDNLVYVPETAAEAREKEIESEW